MKPMTTLLKGSPSFWVMPARCIPPQLPRQAAGAKRSWLSWRSFRNQLKRRVAHLAKKMTRLPAQITEQVSQACSVIERRLASTLQAIHLFGSAIDGGLKPHSDIDLLVTVHTPPDEIVRRALLSELLTVSAPPDSNGTWRPLEVTVVAHCEVVPWRYPARRELQFGEWLRQDLLSGIFEPAVPDADLAILLTMARQRSIALAGPTADALFQPVPGQDFSKALSDTLTLWNSPRIGPVTSGMSYSH